MRDGPVSAPGQDAEFRHLFAQEAEQRLSRLGRQLLELEETGSDEGLVASIFRDAHTLKGSAAMVGFDEVARVAHAMEDLLEQLRSGARTATPELVDELLVAVDGLAAMIPAALDGDDRRARRRPARTGAPGTGHDRRRARGARRIARRRTHWRADRGASPRGPRQSRRPRGRRTDRRGHRCARHRRS